MTMVRVISYMGGIFVFIVYVYQLADNFYLPVHGRKWGRGGTTSSYINIHDTLSG